MTHLNDISKVYLKEVAKKKKDDSYLETDFKKRQANNEKARKDLMKGPQMKNPHFEEKKLDPVGKEDADIDNDGDVDKSDKYLLKRRKAIAKAIKEAKNIHGEIENPSTDLKGAVKKAVKRIDTNVSGDVNKNDKSMGDYGEFVPTPEGKKVTKVAKESFSNWRNDLREVVGEDGDEYFVKEKEIKNKIIINPKISEEVIILESVELSEEHEIETLNYAVDFFVEQGINDDGLEMIIEDLGLEEFVDLVYEVGYETLSEARTLVTKKKTPKKLPKGTAPAKTTKARVAKSGTTMKAASPSGAFKRRPAAAKAVETAKKEQPKKKPVRDAIARGVFGAVKAYKAGMERHKKAMGAAKETGKTIAKAAAVTREAGRRAGESEVGKAVKKAGSAAIKAGVEKVKKDIDSLKVKNRVKKEEFDRMSEEVSGDEKNKLQQKKKMMSKQHMLDKQRLQLQQQGKLPSGSGNHVGEEASDAMKDRHLESGGMGARADYKKLPKGVKTGPMSDAEKKKASDARSRAMDAVRASITAKYGKSAIIDTKKK